MNLGEEIKTHPAVILGGGLFLLFLIYLVSRGSGSSASNAAAMTLQSQGISAQQSVGLTQLATAYDSSVLQYQAATAQLAAQNYQADVNATTGENIAAMSTMQNLAQVAANQQVANASIAESIKQNADNNAATLQLANIASNTAITLAPTQAAVAQAQITANEVAALGMAQESAAASTQIAQIQAAASTQNTRTAANASTTNTLLQDAPAIMGAVAMM